jgi:hypothetical protein
VNKNGFIDCIDPGSWLGDPATDFEKDWWQTNK